MEHFYIPYIFANLQIETELLIIYKENNLLVQDLEELEMENHFKKSPSKNLCTNDSMNH